MLNREDFDRIKLYSLDYSCKQQHKVSTICWVGNGLEGASTPGDNVDLIRVGSPVYARCVKPVDDVERSSGRRVLPMAPQPQV